MESRLLELLGFPDVEDVVFERSPLALTICQIRFPPVYSIAESAFVAPFQRSIASDYPVATDGTDVQLQIGLDADTFEFQQGRRSSVRQFSDLDDNWKVVLAEDFLGLETRKYKHFEDFLERLRTVLESLIQHIAPQRFSRIGLRYINEIRLGSMTSADVVSPDVLGALRYPGLEAQTAHAVTELLLRYPGDEQLRFRHGRFPHGTTVQPPTGTEPSDEPFYLLDFDAFREFTPPGAPLLGPDEVGRLVQMYNHAIYRMFRWSISDTYASTLGGVPK